MPGVPNFHNQQTNRLKLEGQENEIVRTCLDGGVNEQAFRAGSVIPDITVIYYYSEGGKNYKSSHNWNFQQEIMSTATTDDEKCFGYGISLHLITDSVAHTKAVPSKIKSTKVPNWLLHPLLEKKYDSEVSLANPYITNQTSHMLDAMYGPNGEKYISMIEFSLGENIQIDVKKEIDNLAFALDSFYDNAFRPREKDNSLFALYPYLDKITNFVHPIVGKWNVEDINDYQNQNVMLLINTFNNWGSRYALSPHGFSELQQADEEASFFVPAFLILVLLIFTGVPIFLIIKTRKFRYAFLFLLIIPAILFAVSLIYILL